MQLIYIYLRHGFVMKYITVRITQKEQTKTLCYINKKKLR